VAIAVRRLIACLALLAAIPALGGCGTEDLSPSAIAQAADATVASDGMKMQIAQTITVAGEGPLRMGGDGAIDPRHQRSRFTLRMTEAPDAAAGALGNSFTTDVISDHLDVYTRSSQLATVLGKGKRWLKIDVAEVSKAAGLDLTTMTQSSQDPSQMLRQLKAVSGDVERVGAEQVRGVGTTHYRATIDFGRYPELVPAGERAAARASMRQLIKLLGTRTAPVDVWVDDHDLVRRYRQTMHLSIPGGGGRMSMQQQFELYDFGARVDIAVPDAAEVTDMSDLVGGGAAALGGAPHVGP
jgi:hypothetical protein